MLKNHAKAFSNIQKLVDMTVVMLCWWAAYIIRFEYIMGAQFGLEKLFLNITPLIALIVLYQFSKNDLYKSLRFSSRYKEILSVMRANTASFLSLIIILYFFSGGKISRGHLLIFYTLASFSLIITRIIIRNILRTLRKKGKNLRHILLIGNGKQIGHYIKTIKHFKDSGLVITGWIDSDGLAREFDIPELNETYDQVLKEKNIQSITLGYGGTQSYKNDIFLKEHYNEIIPIQLLPDLTYSLLGHSIEDFAGIPLLSINHPEFSGIELFAKRTFDILATFLGLIFISPLLLLIALLIKLTSKGPILYGQERIGLDGQNFTMLKFRSMSTAENNEDKNVWESKNNPRTTKIGNFIRKTSLDELPQLFNVLLGQMTLVGPRPERPFFVEKFRSEIPGYMLRHKMKAGITGWAQVNGWRGDTSLINRIECDIYYIKNWSFWFDIKILFLTLWKGFINKNAY